MNLRRPEMTTVWKQVPDERERVKRMRREEHPLVKGGKYQDVLIVAALWSEGKGLPKSRRAGPC